MDKLQIKGSVIVCPQCSAPFDFEDEGGPISPDPYAPPACGKCMEHLLNLQTYVPMSRHGGIAFE